MDSAALLRLLEPAVRPVAPPNTGAGKAGALPIEERSFEALLAEAKGMTHDDATTTDQTPAAPPVNPLRALHGCGAIENASLRGILGAQK